MQQVWNIIYRNIKSIYSSETWQIGNSTSIFPFCHMNYFCFQPVSALIRNLVCKESSTLISICYLIPLVPLHLFGDTRCLFSNCNLLGDLLVQVWCTYKCIFYSFSCNVIDALIKHIRTWLTKGYNKMVSPRSYCSCKPQSYSGKKTSLDWIWLKKLLLHITIHQQSVIFTIYARVVLSLWLLQYCGREWISWYSCILFLILFEQLSYL